MLKIFPTYLAVSFFSLATNVFGLGEVAEPEAKYNY